MRSLRLALVAVVCLSGWAAMFGEEPAEDAKMKCVRRIEEPGKRLFDPTFSPDGRRLAAMNGEAVYFWDTVTGKKVAKIDRPGDFSWFALSPDEQTVAAVTGISKTGLANTIVVMDIASGKVKHTLKHQDHVTRPAFSPGGKTLISSGGLTALCGCGILTAVKKSAGCA